MATECAASGLPISEVLFLSLPPSIPLGRRRSGGWWTSGGCSAMSLYGRAAPEPGEQPGSGAFPKLAGLPWGLPSSYSSRSSGGTVKLPRFQVLSAVKKSKSTDVLIDLANAARKQKVIRNDPWDGRTGSWYEDCSWPCCAAMPSCVLFLYPLLHEHHILVGSLRQRIWEIFVVVVAFIGFSLFFFSLFVWVFLISS